MRKEALDRRLKGTTRIPWAVQIKRGVWTRQAGRDKSLWVVRNVMSRGEVCVSHGAERHRGEKLLPREMARLAGN